MPKRRVCLIRKSLCSVMTTPTSVLRPCPQAMIAQHLVGIADLQAACGAKGVFWLDMQDVSDSSSSDGWGTTYRLGSDSDCKWRE